MSTSAIVLMILICGFVWGGFLYMLVTALRSEVDSHNETDRH